MVCVGCFYILHTWTLTKYFVCANLTSFTAQYNTFIIANALFVENWIRGVWWQTVTTPCPKKRHPFYIWNNSVKNKPISIFFGTWTPEETW